MSYKRGFIFPTRERGVQMNFHSEWDTLVAWTAHYIRSPPLSPLRHIAFIISIFFSILSLRFLVQHRFLQRWLLFKLSNRDRSFWGRQWRRVAADFIWHLTMCLGIMYASRTAVFGDDAWWAYAHARDCAIGFATHPTFYIWWCYTWAHVSVDLLWLLQYRRFYRTLDLTPLFHTCMCVMRGMTLVIMYVASQMGMCKERAHLIHVLAHMEWPLVYAVGGLVTTFSTHMA